MSSLTCSALGFETLDEPASAPDVVRATLRDIALSNKLFGGRAAVANGLGQLLRKHPHRDTLTVLDVGSGRGDISRYLRRWGSRRGVDIRPIALEQNPVATYLCVHSGLPTVLADAGQLPLKNRSVDVVVASQLLHHFTRPSALALIHELNRVARFGVVVADILKDKAAAVGIWLVSFALAFHPVSRHDGVVSVRRSFTSEELHDILADAGIAVEVRRRPGYRLVAAWHVSHENG